MKKTGAKKRNPERGGSTAGPGRRIGQVFRDMPLRKKLYLCFSVLVILPVMTFSWFLLTSQQRYMTEKTNAYFADSVTQMALRMDHNLEESWRPMP